MTTSSHVSPIPEHTEAPNATRHSAAARLPPSLPPTASPTRRSRPSSATSTGSTPVSSRPRKTRPIAEADGYKIANVGNFGALVERDAMVFHAARRRRMLDSEHEGLVFGRLDLHGDEIRYVGRLGLRDDDARSLVIDWRAPAAAPFYRRPRPTRCRSSGAA